MTEQPFTPFAVDTSAGMALFQSVIKEWTQNVNQNGHRSGQALMNAISLACPMFHDEILGTDLDVFYSDDDAEIRRTIAALSRHLNLA